ncbi:MAG: TRAP transporter substrate-binding protein DctP [Desulfovermiculus sp.]|nr:TRAP transporter substrate-binding protein DctP [Desulfovermiculus sp.]
MKNRKIGTKLWMMAMLAGVIALAAAPVQAEKTFKLTCQNVNAMDHPGFKVIDQLIEDVKVLTDGKLVINQIPPGGMVKSPQTLAATGQGAIDMTITYGCYHGGDLPVAAASFALPGDPREVWEMYNFYYNDGGLDFLREQYKTRNVYYLAPGVWPGYAMMSKKKVENLEDIKKLKVRAAGTMAKMLSNVGVGTTFIPFAEIYQAMSRGTIDATVSGSHAENYLQNLQEVAEYMVEPDFSSAQTMEILVNLDQWNAMPEKMQVAFETAAQKAVLHYTRMFMQMTKTATQDMQEAGCELITLPESTMLEIREASYETWEEIASKDKATAQFIDMVKKDIAEEGYE